MKKIIFTFMLGVGFLTSQSQEWKVPLYDRVPAFTVQDKEGNSIAIESLRGKVVLLTFFATWCPSCREELPHIQKDIWDRWKTRDDFTVMVLAREEGWDKLDPFMKNTGYTFPIYPDLERKVFSLFGDSYIPRNVLIDKEGKIIYRSIGYTEKEFSELVKRIETELEKK
ncbi:TlpA family protein disulfide reductase [Sphingobacterium arenae]|uniref:TlpA family protein disulfide reductase n=1 Tax=Sphingobacterium arenae TaxID=1280598 RepID=A0ABR7Y8B8_9SPHI|nr:TlpA disulfide reductase family protein [Sphingobacterium arenae]MBD1427550.1 TlpA family protein disulfide reductase [Sphingobacterium arenae]